MQGPRIFPSNCCIATIRITKGIVCDGSEMSSSSAEGIAPIKGPKNGITFVTPTITLMSTEYSSFMSFIATKHIIPMIKESSIFPLINPLRELFVFLIALSILWHIFWGNIAVISFLP